MWNKRNKSMMPDRKRVVVVGSGGRLGSSLVSYLRRDHEVTGFARADLDLGCPESIGKALEPLDYDLLFLTGALTAVDYCETHRDEAFAVNASGPGLIAGISAGKGAHVTYISTDLVFDGGADAPYRETDEARPINVYGASKLEGERRVLEATATIWLRGFHGSSGLAGRRFPSGSSARPARKDVTLPGNKTGCPTYTPIWSSGWRRSFWRRGGLPRRGSIICVIQAPARGVTGGSLPSMSLANPAFRCSPVKSAACRWIQWRPSWRSDRVNSALDTGNSAMPPASGRVTGKRPYAIL
jgi:hypothetical protein